VVKPVSTFSVRGWRTWDLGLTINSRFANRLISSATTASLTPISTRLQFARPLVAPLFLYCNVIFYKVAVGVRDRLRLAYNSCVRYVFGIRRSEHISGYSPRILGLLPLGTASGYADRCTGKCLLENLTISIGSCSLVARRGCLIWSSVSITMPQFSGIVCLRQSEARLVRVGSEVNAVRLLMKVRETDSLEVLVVDNKIHM
jgi:hypothetical protein